MITKLKGRKLISLAGLLTSGMLAGNLQAQSVDESEITGRCNYGDCALFHECTDHHDKMNLAELNSKGIIAKAVLSPVQSDCHNYLCGGDIYNQQASEAKCERSKKLADLVLAARKLGN